MKIALTSDEIYPVHGLVIEWLKQHRYEPLLFGALRSGKEEPWVESAIQATTAIKNGTCEEGIFFCWTGTGISIVANKFPEIRAALCNDAETARGARLWNHANVLALSNRTLSQDTAKEILEAWFDNYDRKKGKNGVNELLNFEKHL